MKRVLIIDDEKNIRLTITRSLSTELYHVDQAVSAEEALERLTLLPYDLVLLDIMLPGMSGMDLIKQLRDLSIEARIVVISAHGTIETAVGFLKEGALDFIEKPFSPDEIRHVVAKYA